METLLVEGVEFCYNAEGREGYALLAMNYKEVGFILSRSYDSISTALNARLAVGPASVVELTELARVARETAFAR
jgi:hypothetical protein